jgi:hypothetical protein
MRASSCRDDAPSGQPGGQAVPVAGRREGVLEVIPEPPAGVVGIGAHGRVTADAGDCHLLPPIGAPSVRGGWVGDGFEGALIDAIPAEDPDLCRTEGGGRGGH